MKEIRKARVGLLGLMLEAYDQSFPELHTYGDSFARELAADMSPYADVAYRGVCNTRELVDAAVASF